MKKTKFTDQFLTDLDAMLENGSPETPGSGANLPEGAGDEYPQVLQVAQRLTQADPSQNSKGRLSNRVRLLERAATELPRQAVQAKWKSHLATGLRWGFGITALIGLAIGLSWIFSSLRPSPSSVIVSEATQSPTPSLLGLDTPIEEIVGRMSSAWWNAVWVDGSDTLFTPAGQAETTYTQAWLDRAGRGRVISSESNPGLPSSPQEIPPRFLWISDGQTLAAYDLFNGNYDPANSQFGWASHPLENAGQFMQLIFPYYLNGRGGVFQVVRQEQFAGRDALVLEWYPDSNSPVQERLWVDQLSGFLLRRLRMLPDGTQVEDQQVRSIVYELPLPDNLAGSADWENVRFTANPDEVVIPEVYLPLPTPSQPQVTPIPTISVDSTSLLITTVADDFNNGNPSRGDLYLSLRTFGVEQDQLLRLDDSCLFDPNAASTGCTGYQSSYSTLAWSPLFWSPDGNQAAFLDSNNTRLLSFNPQTGEWLTLSEQFFATAQVLYWSPDGSWIAATLQDTVNNNNSLVTLMRADGSMQLSLAADLAGMQLPIGWLDASRLLFMQHQDVPKGQVGQATDPQLYLYDLNTGSRSPIQIGLSRNAVAQPPVLSPNSSQLIIPSADQEGILEVINLNDPTQAPVEISGMNPVWSPDGQWIALVRVVDGRYKLVVVRSDGSDERKVFEWAAFPVATWVSDSAEGYFRQYLVIEAGPVGDQSGSQLFLVSLADGSTLQILLDGIPSTYELRYPSFRSATDPSIPTNTLPLTATLQATNPLNLYSAQDLALTAADLGEGWILDAEENDPNTTYFKDRGEDGKAVIRTTKPGYPYVFDPALIDSISIRGFSQPGQKLVVFQLVAVFKETAQLEEEFKFYMPGCDLPCEVASVYDDGSGDRSVYRDVLIGDEAVVGSAGDTMEEFFPFITFLHFRKGPVFVSLMSIGQFSDLANSPPIEESRLEQLARIVEARIP
jgi:Tol biopolymer transport system component